MLHQRVVYAPSGRRAGTPVCQASHTLCPNTSRRPVATSKVALTVVAPGSSIASPTSRRVAPLGPSGYAHCGQMYRRSQYCSIAVRYRIQIRSINSDPERRRERHLRMVRRNGTERAERYRRHETALRVALRRASGQRRRATIRTRCSRAFGHRGRSGSRADLHRHSRSPVVAPRRSECSRRGKSAGRFLSSSHRRLSGARR